MKEYPKKWKIGHILGFHNHLKCVEYNDFGLGGETKIEYPNPWSLFGIKYTHYQCLECGRKFWMPKGNFEERRMNEIFFERLKSNA